MMEQPKRKRNARKRRGTRKGNQIVASNPNQSSPFWKKPTSVSFGPSIGFPDRLEAILKFSTTFTFGAAPAPAGNQFAMNSLFDPDQTGGATQPEYFAALASVYALYCVLGGSAVVEITNLSTTEQAFTVATFQEVTGTLGNTVTNLSMSKYAKAPIVGTAGGGHDVVNIKMPYLSTSHINGQKQVESDPTLYAIVGANPTDMWFLDVKCAAVDAVTNVNLVCKVIIYYTAIFKELKHI